MLKYLFEQPVSLTLLITLVFSYLCLFYQNCYTYESMDEAKKQAPKLIVEEVGNTEPPAKAPEAIAEAPPDTNPEVKTEIPEEPVTKFNILWILVPGILVLGLLMGGIFAYLRGLNRLNNPTPTPTATPASASTTPTPTAKQIDLTKYSITVLNGSGIAGEAAKVKDILEKAGFKVASTANAKTYDYTKTEISTKSNVEEDFVKALVAALNKTYQLADPATSSAQTVSAIVTVGSLKVK